MENVESGTPGILVVGARPVARAPAAAILGTESVIFLKASEKVVPASLDAAAICAPAKVSSSIAGRRRSSLALSLCAPSMASAFCRVTAMAATLLVFSSSRAGACETASPLSLSAGGSFSMTPLR